LPRLLVLTAAELTRDPRARRQALAAQAHGFDVAGLSGRISGEPPAQLDGITVTRVGPTRATVTGVDESALGESRSLGPVHRELLGVYRALRLAMRTTHLVRGGRSLGRFDIVHANDLETLPAAAILARQWKARLVYDAHELYADFETRPPRVYTRLARRLEDALARRADAVVAVNEELAADLARRARLRRAPLVVFNAPPLEHVEQQAPGDARLRAVYQGLIGPGRRLELLLDALASAPNVHLTLRLIRTSRDELNARVRVAGLEDRITVAEPVPPHDVVKALAGFDVGLVIDEPITGNANLALPNKLFEYLMAGLAVVAPDLRALGPFIREHEVGALFAPASATALAGRLEELAADRPRLEAFRVRARTVATERFNAEAQAATLLQAWMG
jgi:glycosyltransferase involved in cell wall biosynthesis